MTLASKYYNELINYGGIPTRRGDAIINMYENGMTPRQIDYWLMGNELAGTLRASQPETDNGIRD